MSDTPRTSKAASRDYAPLSVPYEFSQQLERELNEAKEKMLNNPFCAACKEPDCCVSGDGTCAMIRKYMKVDEITKQRDALADALRGYLEATKPGVGMQEMAKLSGRLLFYERIRECRKKSEHALAATKGGSHEPN